MKILSNLWILAVGVAVLLPACEQESTPEAEPTDTGYVSFEAATFTREVRKGDADLELTLTASKTSQQARTYTIAVDAARTTAVEGFDFSLSSSTVTIPAGEQSAKVTVSPDYANLTPSAVTLVLELKADSKLLGEEGVHKVTLTLSRYYRLDMAFLTQTWVAQDYLKGQKHGNPYEVTITANGENAILIDKFFGGRSGQISAAVDFTASTLTIEDGQLIFTNSSGNKCYIYSQTAGGIPATDTPVSATISYQGISIDTYCVLDTNLKGAVSVTTVLTEKE